MEIKNPVTFQNCTLPNAEGLERKQPEMVTEIWLSISQGILQE